MLANLSDVVKFYEQPGSGLKTLVLDSISLSIRAGETLSIVGPSGSGKSTLLNILGTLDTPSSGKVVLDGTDIAAKTQDQLASLRNRFVGNIFQLHYLLPQFTLLENVLLPVLARSDKPDKSKFRQRALHLIDRVGLSGLEERFPYQLSVGECQRGAVVRAFINEPTLILADEPTGSLDVENAEILGRLLVDLNKETGVALVVATHSADLANLMQTRYRLNRGKLITINN